jgi:RNA polymerase sigma-70 factor (ECF subfamily)
MILGVNADFDDTILVEKLRKGDIESFDLLYDRYAARLHYFGMKYLKSEEETEELVQTVFLKVWEYHINLKKESSFKSYLFTIAYNDICKIFRTKYYHQKYVSDILKENPQPFVEIERGFQCKSVLERIQEIIEKLPEKQKVIFRKSREEGKSSREIAEEVGLSPGTVDNYISQSMKFIITGLRNEILPAVLFLSMFFT